MVSTMKIVDTKNSASKSVDGVRVNRTGRRTYTLDYKRAVVRQCQAPGVSVAGIALAHGINANLVRRWMVRAERGLLGAFSEFPAALLPVRIEATAPVRAVEKSRPVALIPIEIELQGVRILVRAGVDREMLRTVLDVLGER